MKRNLSLLLVLSLVLISVMTACLIGCTNAPKALKGVDVKDGDEVIDAIEDFIADGNYTVSMTAKEKGGSGRMKVDVQSSESKLYAKLDAGSGRVNETAIESKKGSVRAYTKMDKKWYYKDLPDIKFKDAVKDITTSYDEMISLLSKMDFEYNKEDKILEASKKIDGVKTEATIEITKEDITIELKDTYTTATIVFSEIGTTEVEMPSGAKPYDDIM